MSDRDLRIPLSHAGLDWVGGRLDRPDPDPGGPVVLLAHGAGVGMDSEFLEVVATGLAAAGLPVLRFHYPYAERMAREGTRRPPDRRPALELAHHAALDLLRERFPDRPVVLAGKSMGGRMSSYLAADGTECAGLVYLGYPLHPAGRPDRLRTEHFPAVTPPALFLQGTRDALCDLELLRPALATHGGPVTLEIVDDADHDFAVPRRSGRTREEVLADLVERTVAWVRATVPG